MRFIAFSVLSVVCRRGVVRSCPESVIEPPPFTKTVNLSGPRFGMTALSPGVVDELEKRSINVGSEHLAVRLAVREAVLRQGERAGRGQRVGGAARRARAGHVLPSLSWLVGLRTREGAEFGIGPNVTPAGVALVVAAGVTMRTGTFNVPLNVAVVPSKVGTRVSVLTGFNMRRR